MRAFDRTGSDELAVVAGDRRVLGVLSETYVLRRYAEELNYGDTCNNPFFKKSLRRVGERTSEFRGYCTCHRNCSQAQLLESFSD